MSATTTSPSDDNPRLPRKPGAQEPPRDLARDVKAGPVSFPCTDHDGTPLVVGNRVLVPCVVTQAHSFGHVNLTVETEHPLRPGMATTTIGLSSHQVVKEGGGGAAPAAPAVVTVACREATIAERSEGVVRPDSRLLFAVFYKEVLNPDDPPLATFSEHADAVDWVKQQQREHDLDPDGVEIVALKLVVPLCVRVG